MPISKAFIRELPLDRPYTELEAAISLQVDFDNEKDVTVAGYSSLWRWSRGKVTRFLNRMGVFIQYTANTSSKQNQRGQIMIQITDRSRTESGQIRLIDNKHLQAQADRKRTESGQITDRSRYTTIDTDTDTDTKKRESTLKKANDPGQETDLSSSSLKDKIIPYSEIVDLYHNKLPSLKGIIKLTETRKRQIAARWLSKISDENGSKSDTLIFWSNFFCCVGRSKFLTGGNGRGWTADLEWLTRESNFVKVLEGRYADGAKRQVEDKWEFES